MVLTCLISILLTLFSIGATPGRDKEVKTESTADQIITEARKYLGAPYRYGATGPSSFDCSGFTGFIFKKFGYTLGRSSRDQALDGKEVKGGVKALRKGDLVIFGSRKDRSQVGHVGIFIEADGDDFYFIHAEHGGVTITRWKYGYYANRYLGARRILPETQIDEDAITDKVFADSLLTDFITSAIDSLLQSPTDEDSPLPSPSEQE